MSNNPKTEQIELLIKEISNDAFSLLEESLNKNHLTEDEAYKFSDLDFITKIFYEADVLFVLRKLEEYANGSK